MRAFILPSAPLRRSQLRPCLCAHGPNSASSSAPGASVPSSSTAKARLLRILPSFINLDTQSAKVYSLILSLERSFSAPATAAFTELALAGRWRLLFSSARGPPSRGEIRLRALEQHIEPTTKILTNIVHWGIPSRFEAVLEVQCKYTPVNPGRINVELVGHEVRFLSGTPSSNLQELIVDLQRSLPIELFDPSGLIDVTYIEPDFRIARFVGKRLAGVRNVFVPVEGSEESGIQNLSKHSPDSQPRQERSSE